MPRKGRREADELDQLAKAFDRYDFHQIFSCHHLLRSWFSRTHRKSSFGRGSRAPARPIAESPAERVVVPRSMIASGSADRSRGPPRHHAATAHEHDDAYMDKFETAYAELAGLPAPARTPTSGRVASGGTVTRARVVADTSVATFRVATLGRQWYKGPTVPEGVSV